MDINLPSHDSSLEDIDMELELGSYFPCCSSSPHHGEFEFQMSTVSLQREATTSPADELFYKGKLLPLHLPLRIEMVEKLLRDSVSAYEELYVATPMAATSMMVSTTFKSCNVLPCESCSISRDLRPEKLQSRSIKQIKLHLFGPKLKGSRTFFKFLIRKSGCSDDSSATATKGFVSASSRRRDESLNGKESPRKQVQPKQSPTKLSPGESVTDETFGFREDRRLLSRSSRRHQSKKICSLSFSSSSSTSSPSSTLASKGGSASWERNRPLYVYTESLILAAIEYCKQSQNPQRGRELEMQLDLGRG